MNPHDRRRALTSGFHASPLTCAVDGLSHVVTDDAAAVGIASRTGTYTALCGHQVHAAALICATGSPCPRCALEVEEQRGTIPEQGAGKGGWFRLRRLLGRRSSSAAGRS